MATNGNGTGWVKYLVGVVVSILISIVTLMGTNVIANDKDSRKRDVVIEGKIEKVKDEIHDELTVIRKEMGVQSTAIQVQHAILKRIENKL